MISIFIFKYTRKNHWKKCNIFWECSSFLSEAERKRVCECVYERLFHVTVSAWKSDKECACGMLFFCVNIYHAGKKERKQQISIIRYEPIVFQAKTKSAAKRLRNVENKHAISQSVRSVSVPKNRVFKTKGFSVLFSGSFGIGNARSRPRGDGGKKTLITRVNRLWNDKYAKIITLPITGCQSQKQTNKQKKNTNSRFNGCECTFRDQLNASSSVNTKVSGPAAGYWSTLREKIGSLLFKLIKALIKVMHSPRFRKCFFFLVEPLWMCAWKCFCQGRGALQWKVALFFFLLGDIFFRRRRRSIVEGLDRAPQLT